MRKDVFAPDWIEALETLQDDAPRLEFSAVREQVETSLGSTLDELYASFEQEPLATASIAQTHRARTKDGDEVVVKVQRPGIEKTMRSDLDLLYLAAQVLEASIDEMQLAGVVSIVEEFEKGLLGELDFNRELSNLLEFQRHLDPERPSIAIDAVDRAGHRAGNDDPAHLSLPPAGRPRRRPGPRSGAPGSRPPAPA